MNNKGPVTQPWVHNLTYMQQSVLLGAVRGPDGFPKYHPVKPVLRWYRRCILISALDGRTLRSPLEEGGGSFIGPSFRRVDWSMKVDFRNGITAEMAVMDRLMDDFMRHMDEMPLHFWNHLRHAFEIVGYKHPDEVIRMWFRKQYFRMTHAAHDNPETEEQLDGRLGDDRAGWIARSDPAIDKEPSKAA